MRRRTRVDLGQQATAKEETNLERKRQRWSERNREKGPEENPFLGAIRPDQDNFGLEDERADELRRRLSNLEFGNFPGYFNYRNNAAADVAGKRNDHQEPDESVSGQQSPEIQTALEAGMSDERLKFFKQSWLRGKEVLDIGCNRGHITYAIARLFEPKSIVGIDIDIRMINMANKDLHLHLGDGVIGKLREDLREQAARQRLEARSSEVQSRHFPLSAYIRDGPLSREERKSADDTESSQCEPTNKFPNNIVFVEHNYVLSRDELVEKQRPFFDTIVCLSVTKWIHLNYCDAGLKRFFRRIYKHLREGGLFILESQPFDNYARRKKLSDRLRANFYTIQFKPDQFDEYLLSKEVGFKSIVHQSVTDHLCAGFKRPLKVFLK